jgi:hypothetical protein
MKFNESSRYWTLDVTVKRRLRKFIDTTCLFPQFYVGIFRLARPSRINYSMVTIDVVFFSGNPRGRSATGRYGRLEWRTMYFVTARV